MMRRILFVSLLTVSAGCGGRESAAPKVAAPKNEQTAESKDEPAPPKKANEKPIVAAVPTLPPLQVEEKKDQPRPKETVALTAEAFYQTVHKEPKEAAKKFDDVQVELTGVVRMVGSRDQETFVTLDGGPDALGVVCVFADLEQPWAKIVRGQKLKVRGLWPQAFVQPSLVACEIVDLGDNKLQEARAEELAEEFAKDAEALRKKYAGQPLIVSGVIVDAKTNDLGAVRVFLKGAGIVQVDCGFDAADRKEALSLPAKQRIRLVGEFSAIESNNGPALRSCRQIK